MAMMTVNGQRLQAHLEALADIARTPDGICRLSYSDSFWKSNAYVAQLMREAGMSVTTNPLEMWWALILAGLRQRLP